MGYIFIPKLTWGKKKTNMIYEEILLRWDAKCRFTKLIKNDYLCIIKDFCKLTISASRALNVTKYWVRRVKVERSLRPKYLSSEIPFISLVAITTDILTCFHFFIRGHYFESFPSHNQKLEIALLSYSTQEPIWRFSRPPASCISAPNNGFKL